MFTGIIEDIGSAERVLRSAGALELTIATRIDTAELTLGESVAVNGACLTVMRIDPGSLTAQVSEETLRATTLGEIGPSRAFNLERALRIGDRLGGHIVSGHVDDVGTVRAVLPRPGSVEIEFEISAKLARYLVYKGSVAVDGVSLTVARCRANRFAVALIEHTLAQTTLKDRKVGDRANIEFDIIGKYVESLMQGGRAPEESKPIDKEFLGRHGFL